MKVQIIQFMNDPNDTPLGKKASAPSWYLYVWVFVSTILTVSLWGQPSQRTSN